jgi:hypothetical protein
MTELNLEVVGEEYPLPPARALISRILSIAQVGLVIAPFLVGRIPAVVSHPYYQVFQEKKFIFLIGGWFLISTIQSQVSATGAFEIYLDDRLLFSKLVMERMPSGPELSALLHR